MRFLNILLLALIMLANPVFAGSVGQEARHVGQHRVAIIMLAWTDRDSPVSREQAVDLIWNNDKSIRNYILDMSRGLYEVVLPPDVGPDGIVPSTTSSVYGPYTLSVENGYYTDITYYNSTDILGGSRLYGAWYEADQMAALKDGFSHDDYDYVIYATPKGRTTDRGLLGYAWPNTPEFHAFSPKTWVFNHEFGHTVGLSHSNTTIGRDGYNSQDCVMGNQASPHFDSVHTYGLGWYPDDVFASVGYGQYTIENLAQPDTDNLKSIRFDRSAFGATVRSDHDVWVSYRVRGIGHDNELNGNWDRKMNIHYCQTASWRSSDPYTSYKSYYLNNNVGKFEIDQSFTDEENLVTARMVREETTGFASAVIQLIDPNGNQPPSVVFGQTIPVTVGDSVFTIDTTDLENDDLTFTIVETPAHGTLTTTGDTFSYTSEEIGFYTFVVRANDGQYDSYDEVVTLEVKKVVPPGNSNPFVSIIGSSDISLTQGSSAPWSPSDMVTYAWYDANDPASITLEEDNVVSISDKSGSGYVLSQTNATQRPTYGTRTINGLNVFDFDGNDFMIYNPIDLTSGDIAVFMVSEIDTVNSSKNAIYSFSGQGGGDLQAGNSSQFNGVVNNYGVGTIALTGGPFTGPSLFNVNYDFTGVGNYNAFVDGTQRATDTSYTTQLRTNPGFKLFASSGGSSPDGAVGEIILTKDLSEETRLKIEGYLAHKWGLTDKLPSDHIYKTNVPERGGESATTTLTAVVTEPDNDPYTVKWTYVEPSNGAKIYIVNDESITTDIIFDKVGEYTVIATAMDQYDLTGSNTFIVTVNEFGGTTNTAPVAVPTLLGPTDPKVGDIILLSGASSYDVDGDTIVSYTWNQTFGPSVDIDNIVDPQFVANVAGDYVFELTVSDGQLEDTTQMGLIVEDVVTEENTSPVISITYTIEEIGGESATPWSPADITTFAWYDPTDSSSIELDGSSVIALGDKSGSGYVLSQTNASSRPTYGTRFINGMTALNFDGNDWMIHTPIDLTSGDVALFVVSEIDIIDTTKDAIFSFSGFGGTDLRSNNSTQFVGKVSSKSLTGGPFTGPSIFNVNFDYNGVGMYNAFVDGTQRASDTSYVTQLRTNPGFKLFASSGGKSPDGAIGEVIMVKDMSEETRLKIEGYLAHKWGLTANLPSDHIYKSNAPTNGSGPSSTSWVATLDGWVYDNEGHSISSYLWEVVGSDPSLVEFGNNQVEDTTATFTVEGSYTLRLSATDELGLLGSNTIVINATSNIPPVADTSLTQTEYTEDETGSVDVTLNGSLSSDVDGSVQQYEWTKGGVFVSSFGVTVISLSEGVHTYTLVVTDDKGATSSSQVVVTVGAYVAPNTAPIVSIFSETSVSLTSGTATPWTPADITTLAWYDPTDSSSMTLEGSSVVTWDDKSGSGYVLSQTSASSRPTLGTRYINGLDVLDADGNDWMIYNPIDLTSGDIATFIVSEVDLINNSKDSIFSFSGFGGTEFRSNSSVEFLGKLGSQSLTGGPFTGPSIFNTNYDYTGLGIFNAFVDGTKRTPDGAYTTQLRTNPGFKLFASSGGQSPDGAIGEVILTKDLSEETRLKIEGYLAHKWGLTANLPSDHIYKSNAPMNGSSSAMVFLDGAVYDVEGHAISTLVWELVEPAPASVYFDTPTQEDTNATFTVVGEYTIRLTATDELGLSGDNVMMITVE